MTEKRVEGAKEGQKIKRVEAHIKPVHKEGGRGQ